MQLPLTRELVTQRCRLRFPSAEEIRHVFSATRVEGFNDGMLWEPVEKEEDLLPFLEQNRVAWQEDRGYTFTFLKKDEEVFLGRIAIRREEQDGWWNVGFWTHPDHQRRGYMTEVAGRIVQLGFEELAAERIEAWHAAWNLGSRRVLEKIGMSFRRHEPKGFMKKGKWVPEDLLAITRTEWEAREERLA